MYMSPEIATGDPHLDERSDIFALGNPLEMLTFQSFVDGEDIIEIKEKILNKPYPPQEKSHQIVKSKRLASTLYESTNEKLAVTPIFCTCWTTFKNSDMVKRFLLWYLVKKTYTMESLKRIFNFCLLPHLLVQVVMLFTK